MVAFVVITALSILLIVICLRTHAFQLKDHLVAKRPTLSTIGSGFYGTTQLNDNFDNINTAFDNTLSLDGSTPNQMTADIDLNNNDVLNVSSLQATGITLNGVGITPTSVAATPAASSIVMTDAGGYYTTDNVEAALQELPTQYHPLTSLTGNDSFLVSGTAGTSGNVATWDANGDVVDGGYAPGAMVFIESQDASGSAMNFTGFDATKYDSYVFTIGNLEPGIFQFLYARVSIDGGSTFLSASGSYQGVYRSVPADTGTEAITGTTTATTFVLSPVGVASANEGLSGELRILHPHLAAHTSMMFQGVLSDTGGDATWIDTRMLATTTSAVDAISFFISTGSFASGTITMYGIRNS